MTRHAFFPHALDPEQGEKPNRPSRLEAQGPSHPPDKEWQEAQVNAAGATDPET